MEADIKNSSGQWETIVGSQPSPAFKLWSAMRHDTNNTMSPNFQDWNYFANWCQGQIGYNLAGYVMNKDLLKPGNTEYHEDFCVFVPKELDTFLKE